MEPLPIQLIGTNHISNKSVQDIKDGFFSFEPDIIAIELDKGRLHQLLHPEEQSKSLNPKLIRKLGVRGFLFALISRWAQQRLGKMTGVKPGSEMLTAVNLAKNNNKELELIDRPIQITIKRLMKQLTFKEKRRFAYDLLFSRFSKKQKVKLDIANVPDQDLITTLVGQVKERYPTVHRVLIDERDKYMARKLILIHKKNPDKKILGVIGAGHKQAMEHHLEHYNRTIETLQ